MVKVVVMREPTVDVTSLSTVVVQAGIPYDGSYEVTPKAYDDQLLPTAGKAMREDVKVFKVPKYDVDNVYGGITISIAEG